MYFALSMFWLMKIRKGQVLLLIAGEGVRLFQALCREQVIRFWKFWCARQRDMVSRGREVVGLEVSDCCVVSTCCSKAGGNVVSEGVAFSGCDVVKKLVVLAVHAGVRAMYTWSYWGSRL
jgi:hypothetical protein